MRINELNVPVQPDTYEASMFLTQAIRAGKYAIKIHNLLSNDQEMESWVAKKIENPQERKIQIEKRNWARNNPKYV